MTTTITNCTRLFKFVCNEAATLRSVYHEFVPVVAFVRGGNVVAMAGVPQGDLSSTLMAATMGQLGFDADAIMAVHPGFVTASPTNPLTGREWTPDEMHDVYVNDGGLGGLVSEAAVGVYVTRDGRCEAIKQTVTCGRDKRMVWGEAEVVIDGDDDHVDGVLPHTLRAIMRDPMALPGADDINRHIEEACEELGTCHSDDETMYNRDLATSAMMLIARCVPLWNDGKPYFKL